jgi:hypothetical protein
MQAPPPNDPLDPLLDRWKSIPDPSPRLSAEVWQRIATSDADHGRVVRGPWATFGSWLERPAFAFGFVAACAIVGLLLAEVRVSRVQRDRNAQLARSYLQLIDPLVSTVEPEDRS